MTAPDSEADAPGRHRRVLTLALPIILANLSTPLLGAVDTAVMGHLPDPAFIGGVSVGALVFSFLYWGFGFLRMGTTGFAAQALGADDRDELRAVLGRALLLAGGLGTALIALQWPIGALAFDVVDATPAVLAHAETYFGIRIFSAPFALTNYAVLGWLLGTQRARHALALQVALNGVNIVLDLVFVVGLGMTIAGVAWASLLAEIVAAGIGLTVCWRVLARTGGVWSRARLLDRERLVAMLRVNRDIFLRTLALIFAFAYFTARGAAFGEVTLAANTVLMQFQQFLSHGLDGFAHATEILVGRSVGAADRAGLRRAVRTATLWAVALAAGAALVFAGAGTLLIAVMTDLAEVRGAAGSYLPWMIASPLLSVWAFQLDGVFIGATRTAAMRTAMLASLAIYLGACWALIPIWGNHGLWLALMVFMAVRGLSLGAAYPRLVRAVTPTPA